MFHTYLNMLFIFLILLNLKPMFKHLIRWNFNKVNILKESIIHVIIDVAIYINNFQTLWSWHLSFEKVFISPAYIYLFIYFMHYCYWQTVCITYTTNKSCKKIKNIFKIGLVLSNLSGSCLHHVKCQQPTSENTSLSVH